MARRPAQWCVAAGIAALLPGCAAARPPLAAVPVRPDLPAPDGAQTRFLESLDPVLSDALAQVAASPTAGNLSRAGDAYLGRGILDQAFDYYERALRVDAGWAGAHDGQARIWRDWGMPHLALAAAHRAVHHAPRSATARNTLGTVLQALGQLGNARAAYEHALALQPGAAFVLNNLCYLNLVEGDARAGVAACQRAVAADPTLRTAHHNLVIAHAAAGDMRAAAGLLEAAGDTAEAAFNLGLLHLARHEYREAAGAFARSFDARPTPEAARRLRQARDLAARPPGGG